MDVSTAPILHDAVDDVLMHDVSAVIIDLSAVTFFASAGLQILVRIAEIVTGRTRFAVVAQGSATRRPIKRTKLDSAFSLHETVEAALRDASSADE